MMRVMVVEDEEMIRKGIVMAVDWAALDCIVVGEAANGEQALAVAEDCQPTLIITDLKMPKMDGLEMVRRLREAGSRAYVIILTAYDSFAYAQTAIRLGAVDFLLKPFHDGDLENAVLALQKRIAAQTAPQPEPLPGVKPGPKSRYVREAMVYLEQNCGSGDLSVGQAAAQLGLSEGHLSHLFKKETDMTLGAYLTRCRIQKAMALLREGKLKVYEVAERLPRYCIFFRHLQKNHRENTLGVSGQSFISFLGGNAMYCILVAGMPASGKSTIAVRISESLGIPMLSKDSIKEVLFDDLGFHSRAEKVQLGTAAMHILYYAAAQLMKVGKPFILENNFEDASIPGIMALLETHHYTAVTVRLTGDPEVIYRRFAARDLSNTRHRGHVWSTTATRSRREPP